VRPISPIKLNFVLVNPRVHSSTKEIFSRWTPSSHSLNVTEIAEKALLTRDINLLASVISNDLKNAAVSLHSEIGEALEALKSENVLATSMTGSGSTVFALVSSSEEAIFIAERMKKRGYLAFSVSSL
jgi:4-diphosphocytidyl-2C-methyl-D-erythritol kinase